MCPITRVSNPDARIVLERAAASAPASDPVMVPRPRLRASGVADFALGDSNAPLSGEFLAARDIRALLVAGGGDMATASALDFDTLRPGFGSAFAGDFLDDLAALAVAETVLPPARDERLAPLPTGVASSTIVRRSALRVVARSSRCSAARLVGVRALLSRRRAGAPERSIMASTRAIASTKACFFSSLRPAVSIAFPPRVPRSRRRCAVVCERHLSRRSRSREIVRRSCSGDCDWRGLPTVVVSKANSDAVQSALMDRSDGSAMKESFLRIRHSSHDRYHPLAFAE